MQQQNEWTAESWVIMNSRMNDGLVDVFYLLSLLDLLVAIVLLCRVVNHKNDMYFLILGSSGRTEGTLLLHHQAVNLYLSTMHLASLNIDALIHLMKFVHPVDCVNLAPFWNFEWIWKYKPWFGSQAKVLPHSDNPTWIKLFCTYYPELRNNRKLSSGLQSYSPRFFGDICSMMKLENLNFYCKVKLEQLLPLFRSCPKLVHLRLDLFVNEKLELDEHLRKELNMVSICFKSLSSTVTLTSSLG